MIEYHDLSKKDLYANLKAMTRQYFYLLQNNVSCKNRYKRLINICFPELEKIFKSTRIYDDTALNFIKEFPYAEIVKEKRIDALYNNLYKTNGRNLNFYKKLATTIKQSGKSINVKVKLGASNYPEHPVYIYYQNKKAEGKHYYESLTACSTKILRMLYSMCKNNKQFLEN